MIRLIDSHCHLDMLDAEVRSEAVARAVRAGVRGMLTIATRLSAAEQVIAIAKEYSPHVRAAVGVHPHRVGEQGVPDEAELVSWGARPDVVGLGETGLDYFYDKSPRDQQQESFRRHIRASNETGTPFIVHTRNADADTIAILKEEAAHGALRGVLHCFSSGREVAEAALELGMYVSLAGIVTFKNAVDVQSIAADVPLDRLLVETDSPYLAPIPMRGKPNEPGYVIHTARKLAELKGVTEQEMAVASTANFARLFDKAAGLATA